MSELSYVSMCAFASASASACASASASCVSPCARFGARLVPGSSMPYTRGVGLLHFSAAILSGAQHRMTASRRSRLLKLCKLRLEQAEDDDDLVLALSLVLLRRSQRRHRWWVHPINQRRDEHGTYHHLFRELLVDGERFHCFWRDVSRSKVTCMHKRTTRGRESPVVHISAARCMCASAFSDAPNSYMARFFLRRRRAHGDSPT